MRCPSATRNRWVWGSHAIAVGVAIAAVLAACADHSGGSDSPAADGAADGGSAADAMGPRGDAAPDGGSALSDGGGSGMADGSSAAEGGPSSDATFDGPGVPDGSVAADGGPPRDATTDGPDATGEEAGAAAVRIVGRTTTGTMGPRFEWSGVSMAARFTGTQVSIQLNDGSNQNEFEVVVDGAIQPTIVTHAGTTTYPVVTGLADGTHELTVWRRSEASYGFTELLGLTGFSAGGTLLAPPPAPAHQIEVIGDSISCGFGIEGDASCTNAQLESIENDYLAYGSVAARALAADVVTIAWSGIGVYRNYDQAGPSTNTMPDRYDFAIPTAQTPWDFSKYQPQAVVINLTSNDFSTMGDPGQPYIDAFVAFVQHVRSKYAGAYFFLVIEWRGNGSDSAPDVNAVVSKIQAGGDANIESFDIRPYSDGNACQGHPDVAGAQAMGNALAAEIKKVLKW
jgi:lysophospholipase L1-like esterase